MKRIILFANIIALILLSNIYAQRPGGSDDWGRMGGKIEQLEKIKIIEELNLDEETTLKFFVKRNNHRESQKQLLEKRDLLFKNLTENFNSDENVDYKNELAKIFAIEKEMLVQKEKFYKSLSKIFSDKQLVQLSIFEFNFRNEVRHQFIKQGKKRIMNK